MQEFRVTIPDEKPRIIEFVQDDCPGIAYINRALQNFEPKEVFSWHLSIMLGIEEIVENGMPSREERELLDKFGELLDTNIKGIDKEKPNALFLARITWNKTRELIWRVYNPEPTERYLQDIIENDSSPRPFDYRMEQDKDWKLTEWHLK
jgi:hypothetical protein